jgi:hypothetical protein
MIRTDWNKLVDCRSVFRERSINHLQRKSREVPQQGCP